VAGVVAEAAHVLVEEVTLAGIRTTVEAFRHGDLEARLARYHGRQTRATFFNWADTWLADAFRDWNIEACLPQIRCAVLVLQGLDDPYGTSRQATAIAAGIGARARQVLLADCGHTPHREAPRRTLEAIRDFSARLTEARGRQPCAEVDEPC
jgi:pimeloyl-ACP methyl ester carboxylesterase